jgi:hypothetical protein
LRLPRHEFRDRLASIGKVTNDPLRSSAEPIRPPRGFLTSHKLKWSFCVRTSAPSRYC